MNCDGCPNRMDRMEVFSGRPECCFTKSGILSLENCLCETCLIKPVCNDFCDDFIEMVRRDKNSDHRLFPELATGYSHELNRIKVTDI
jgi:hypothetical protein